MILNKFLYLLSTLLLLDCQHSSTSRDNKNQEEQEQTITDTIPKARVDQPPAKVPPADLFTLPDAEKILGEQARLTDSASTINGDTLEYKCTYSANSKDPQTGKTGNVYFLFEQYAQVSIAKKVFASIRRANEDHKGVSVLDNVGDEAYFHSDGQNFYFILARKENKMIRMKVNKVTSKTSPDEFNSIAKHIMATL